MTRVGLVWFWSLALLASHPHMGCNKGSLTNRPLMSQLTTALDLFESLPAPQRVVRLRQEVARHQHAYYVDDARVGLDDIHALKERPGGSCF